MSTLDSYESKAKDPSAIIGKNDIIKLNTPEAYTSLITSKNRTEEQLIDEEMKLQAAAFADAELGLENLSVFNEEMGTISMNAFQIYSLFELISNENEEIISWMHQLER